MATLLTNVKLGNTSVSGLVKSATTLQNELNSYNDAVAAQTYNLSNKTDSDFQTYQNYLQGRITTLQSTGTVTDATKAVTLTNTMTAAMKANITSNIQAENIQVMEGNATPTDKLSIINSEYLRAYNNGDMAEAQTLESQGLSLSQTIQVDAQNAATAATALSNANASALSKTASNIGDTVKELDNTIKAAGLANTNKAVAQFVKANAATLAAYGVTIPKGITPNYADLIIGIKGAQSNQLKLAAAADAVSNPSQSQSYTDSANALLTDGISTLMGTKTPAQLVALSNQPGGWEYDPGTQTIKVNQTVGLNYVPSGQAGVEGSVEPVYSKSVINVASPNLTAQLGALGLTMIGPKGGVSTTAAQGQTVSATAKTPAWLASVIGKVNNVYETPQGIMFQNAATTKGGEQATYTIMADPNGKKGLIEQTQDAQGKLVTIALPGEYGFSPKDANGNWLPKATGIRGAIDKIGNAASNLLHDNGRSPANSLPNGKQDELAGIFENPDMMNPSTLIENATAQQAEVKAAAAAMLKSAPTALPTITLPTATPPTAITPTVAVAPKTVAVQPATVNPQQQTAPRLQGGSVNLQGGSGISLK